MIIEYLESKLIVRRPWWVRLLTAVGITVKRRKA
jgi:hypothetical protein